MRQILILFLLFPAFLMGQGHFTQTNDIKVAYNLILDLRLEESKLMIEQIKKSDPNNLLRLHLENYIDFFTIFIDEDKNEFKRLEKNKNRRLDYIEKHGDVKSPYYLFVQAEIELQWALVRAKFNEVFSAASEIYSAYRLLSENQSKFPDFIANKKSLSAIHVLVESIPGIVRRIFSINGTIAQGTHEIQDVINYSQENDFLYKEEAIAIYSYILFFQNNKKKEAWDFLKNSHLDPKESPLISFLMASMAQKMGENDYAIRILEQRPKSKEYHPFYYLDFLLAKSKLYRLDSSADEEMHLFINQFNGAHYIKEAYQKLAWYELVVNSDRKAYQAHMEACKKYGNDLIDSDKQALKEAKSRQIPNAILLKGRLLYDGGYYQRSYDLLLSHPELKSSDKLIFLEYHYRLGRITQKLGLLTDAIKNFNVTVNKGYNSDIYYACNAALQLGLIYEEQEEYLQAENYFERCLDINPSDYKNSLHQKAKSGLNRIRNQ